MTLKYEVVTGIEPSFAERLIAKELADRNIVFCQEVIFENCVNPSTGLHLRFDFYLPVQNILIEYDGKESHADTDTKGRDRLKTKFAKDNKIKLVRLSGISYIAKWAFKQFGAISDIPKEQPAANSLEMASKNDHIQIEVDRLRKLKAESLPRYNQRLNLLRNSRNDKHLYAEIIKRITY